jgi:hypothetical protein
MRKAGVAILFALLVAAVAPAADEKPVDVSGTWTMTRTTPDGERTSSVVFVQDGERLTVTMKGRHFTVTGPGSVKGSSIEWSFTHETSMGTVTSVYKGTVAGDTMSGELTVLDRPIPWKATRDKEQPAHEP